MPARRTVPGGTPVDPSPLYRLRWMFFVNLAAVPLGLGRVPPSTRPCRRAEEGRGRVVHPGVEDPVVQLAVARVETLVGSARSYLLDTVDAVWRAVLADADTTAPGSGSGWPTRTRSTR